MTGPGRRDAPGVGDTRGPRRPESAADGPEDARRRAAAPRRVGAGTPRPHQTLRRRARSRASKRGLAVPLALSVARQAQGRTVAARGEVVALALLRNRQGQGQGGSVDSGDDARRQGALPSRGSAGGLLCRLSWELQIYYRCRGAIRVLPPAPRRGAATHHASTGAAARLHGPPIGPTNPRTSAPGRSTLRSASGNGRAGRQRGGCAAGAALTCRIEQAGNQAIADLIKQRLDQSGIPRRRPARSSPVSLTTNSSSACRLPAPLLWCASSASRTRSRPASVPNEVVL